VSGLRVPLTQDRVGLNYSVSYILNSDGTRHSAAETELQPNGTTATLSTTWTYDALDRLTGETITSSLSGGSQSETWSYDMDGNRVKQVKVAGGVTDTTTYTYNGDNELTQQVDSVAGTTTFGYDANGSQTTTTVGGTLTQTNYYDVRNRLQKVVNSSGTTTYVYDDAGDRVQETTGSTTTYYLIDSNNPTGYAKPIEVRVGSATGTPTTTYILGLNVIGQANSSGAVSYLVIDGRDDTRALVNSSGAVTAVFNYDAFGNPIGFTAATAPTVFLFQQMMFDGPSGTNFTQSREELLGAPDWLEMDSPIYSILTEPLTLNLSLFEDADPGNGRDPTGHDDLAELMISVTIDTAIETSNALSTAALGTEEGAGAADLAEDYDEVLEAEEATVDENLTPAEEENLDEEASSIAENAANGNKFQNEALQDKGLVPNKTSYTETINNREVTTIPDSYEEGVQMTEVKNVQYQYNSSQLRAQMQLAESTDTPYTLIVNQSTRLSQPLIDALKAISATVEDFDPLTNTFTTRVLP
jgi:YD repeat-containing protein